MKHGHYCGIRNALRLYPGPWYLIPTTRKRGTEEDIIDSVGEQHEVKIIYNEEGENLSFSAYSKDSKTVLNLENIRLLQYVLYEV